MTSPTRPASAYVHGTAGPVAVVPGRIAAWLERYCNLGRLRVEERGADAEVDAVLTALAVAAAAWRGSVSGTDARNLAEPAAESKVMTTRDVADRLDVEPRTVTKAITEGRLKATKAGRQWLVDSEDLAHYLAARAA